MTEREKLEEIKAKLLSSEENTFNRMKKENVLDKLILSTEETTGTLSKLFVIPIYEHDVEFLKQTLKDFGYSPEYKKEFNPFFETTCYTVKL